MKSGFFVSSSKNNLFSSTLVKPKSLEKEEPYNNDSCSVSKKTKFYSPFFGKTSQLQNDRIIKNCKTLVKTSKCCMPSNLLKSQKTNFTNSLEKNSNVSTSGNKSLILRFKERSMVPSTLPNKSIFIDSEVPENLRNKAQAQNLDLKSRKLLDSFLAQHVTSNENDKLKNKRSTGERSLSKKNTGKKNESQRSPTCKSKDEDIIMQKIASICTITNKLIALVRNDFNRIDELSSDIEETTYCEEIPDQDKDSNFCDLESDYSCTVISNGKFEHPIVKSPKALSPRHYSGICDYITGTFPKHHSSPNNRFRCRRVLYPPNVDKRFGNSGYYGLSCKSCECVNSLVKDQQIKELLEHFNRDKILFVKNMKDIKKCTSEQKNELNHLSKKLNTFVSLLEKTQYDLAFDREEKAQIYYQMSILRRPRAKEIKKQDNMLKLVENRLESCINQLNAPTYSPSFFHSSQDGSMCSYYIPETKSNIGETLSTSINSNLLNSSLQNNFFSKTSQTCQSNYSSMPISENVLQTSYPASQLNEPHYIPLSQTVGPLSSNKLVEYSKSKSVEVDICKASSPSYVSECQSASNYSKDILSSEVNLTHSFSFPSKVNDEKDQYKLIISQCSSSLQNEPALQCRVTFPLKKSIPFKKQSILKIS